VLSDTKTWFFRWPLEDDVGASSYAEYRGSHVQISYVKLAVGLSLADASPTNQLSRAWP